MAGEGEGEGGGEGLLLAELQVLACDFTNTKTSNPTWVLFTFFKL